MFLPVLIAFVAFQGCEKAEVDQLGSLDFGMSPVDDVLKSLDADRYDVHAALVTIVNVNGEKVFDKEYIEFFSFGNSFVTKSINLNVGDYLLSEFMLVDSASTVIWATPTEGSRLANLVSEPVPIQFSVYLNNTTHLYPQVVRVANHNPDDFGYVNFHVEFVDNFCIGVFFESFCNDWYMGPGGDGDSSQFIDTVFYSDSAIYLDNGLIAPFFPSRLVIYSDNEIISETYLYQGENKIPIPRRGYDMFSLMVFNCGNQLCFNQTFGLDELRHFSCAEGEQLFINCEPYEPEVIITPEDILEPTIEQGVFGTVTQPAWDSTIYEDYTTQPMITDLYIYKAEVGDSLFYLLPSSDCYVYPDLYVEPLAVVRTNSSGIYQLPLEEGIYNYLVKTDYGYYLDAYISSRYPGVFEVKDGEVTLLNIHVILFEYY